MNSTNISQDQDRTRIYEIRIKNHLDRDWSVWFEGLSITQEPGGVTLISGPVVDQAELYGLLKRINQLGLQLISVNETESPSR